MKDLNPFRGWLTAASQWSKSSASVCEVVDGGELPSLLINCWGVALTEREREREVVFFGAPSSLNRLEVLMILVSSGTLNKRHVQPKMFSREIFSSPRLWIIWTPAHFLFKFVRRGVNAIA